MKAYVLILALSLHSIATGEVIVVDPMGGGDYTDVSQAVTLASSSKKVPKRIGSSTGTRS